MTVRSVVTDGLDTWLEWRTYIGYSWDEAVELFREYLTEKGWRYSQ